MYTYTMTMTSGNRPIAPGDPTPQPPNEPVPAPDSTPPVRAEQWKSPEAVADALMHTFGQG